MKVVYVKSVIEKIRDARDEAEKWGKKIDYIELTKAEWAEIQKAFVWCEMGVGITKYTLCGVEVREAK
jgi:hypothetical protein